MPQPASQRPAREWFLLLVALGIVAAITIPAWQVASGTETRADFLAKWTPERLAKLLLGPEQAACYVCFVWASLVLLVRYREIARQRGAFHQELLPTEEGARILPEDARPLVRKVEQITARRGPSILAHMIRLGLGKYAVSKSAPDVAEVVRNQADIEYGRLTASLGGLVSYLAWAIPAIGFIGTVRGLAGAFGMAGATEADIAGFTRQATDQLKIAFDCTLVALVLSILLMYLLHTVQRGEETLVIDCQEYCQEHLLLRLYEPAPAEEWRS
ncbi:MAG: MotA/TolQ/ExbB proton channel family protein [Gemmataceae bacterium]